MRLSKSRIFTLNYFFLLHINITISLSISTLEKTCAELTFLQYWVFQSMNIVYSSIYFDHLYCFSIKFYTFSIKVLHIFSDLFLNTISIYNFLLWKISNICKSRLNFKQGLASYHPRFGHLSWLSKYSFIGAQAQLFVNILSMADFLPQWQSWVIAMETV